MAQNHAPIVQKTKVPPGMPRIGLTLHWGQPSDVIPDIEQEIVQIVSHPSVSAFYIGRSVNVQSRRDVHADVILPRPKVEPEYEGSLTNVMRVEQELLSRFVGKARKCINRAPDPRGDTTNREKQHVYLLYWTDLRRNQFEEILRELANGWI